MDNQEKLLITPAEACEVLGIGRNAIYEIIRKDKTFPCFRLPSGNRIFINKDKLQGWIDNMTRRG